MPGKLALFEATTMVVTNIMFPQARYKLTLTDCLSSYCLPILSVFSGVEFYVLCWLYRCALKILIYKIAKFEC